MGHTVLDRPLRGGRRKRGRNSISRRELQKRKEKMSQFRDKLERAEEEGGRRCLCLTTGKRVVGPLAAVGG